MGDKEIIVADPEIPHPAKLIAGIIASSEKAFSASELLLEKEFGPPDYRSVTIPFDFTDYYEKEMGSGLKRRFLSFKRLIDPALLADIKLTANRIEAGISGCAAGVKRPVNIDPGYITDAKLVLASTKDYSHRIYLGRGIYAEVTLFYKDRSFRSCEWTYPDYRTEAYIEIFNHIRGIFLKQRNL